MNKEEFKQSSPLLPESSSQYNMKSDSPPSKPTLSIRKKKQRQEKQAFRNFADFDLPITQVPLANYKVFHSSLCDLRLPPVSSISHLALQTQYSPGCNRGKVKRRVELLLLHPLRKTMADQRNGC